MYASRALKHLLDWKSSEKLDDVSSIITEDFLTKDSDYSFYATPSFDNPLDKNNRNNVLLLIVCNPSSWSASIGLLFIEKNKIENDIKKFNEDKPGPLGTVHYNLPALNFKEMTSLIEIMFSSKNDSHQYCFKEIESFFSSLTNEEWLDLFGNYDNETKLKKAKEIKRFYYRDESHGLPSFLENIIKTKGLTS